MNQPSPRFIRQGKAAAYLGMSQPLFNKRVRPYVTVIRGEGRAIFYDRIDLDRWADDYKRANGVPGLKLQEIETWQKPRPDSKNGEISGILKKPSAVSGFTVALRQVNSPKLKGI